MLLEIANAILPSPISSAPSGQLAKFGINLAALEHKDVWLTLRVTDNCVFSGSACCGPEDNVAHLESHGWQLACTTTAEKVDDGQKDDRA
jgi:hypothetical protein